MFAGYDLRTYGFDAVVKALAELRGVAGNDSRLKPLPGVLRGGKQRSCKGRSLEGRDVQHDLALNARCAKSYPACVVVVPGPGLFH
jgi:hypothetical protein